MNPFGYTPQEMLKIQNGNVFLSSLFPHLNSPDYYTIYPPICQYVFQFINVLSDDIRTIIISLKSIIFFI